MASPRPPDLTATLARARAGDRDAMGELLERIEPEIEVFVRLNRAEWLRSRESVSDLRQSICADLIGELDRFEDRGPGSFRAWLRKVALNKLIDKARHHRAAARDVRRERAMPGTPTELGHLADTLHALPSPSQAAIGHEEAELLEKAMAELPEEQRQVVTMARLLGMPHAEIAEVVGKTEAACRMLLRRGMVRLAALMEKLDRA